MLSRSYTKYAASTDGGETGIPATADDSAALAATVDAEEAASEVADEVAGEEASEVAGEDAIPEDNAFVPLKQVKDMHPEAQAHFKQMQRAYTKKLGEISGIKERAAIVDKFYNDSLYATQVLQQWAAQNGYTVTKAGQPAARVSSSPDAAGVPAELVEAVEKHLDPSLSWLAQSIAAAQWAAYGIANKPMVEQRQAEQRANRENIYGELSSQLSEDAPGWEEHEQDMVEMLNFLQSDALSSKRFGSKLQMLYDAVTKNAATTSQLQKRAVQAATKRASSAGVKPSAISNIAERVRTAKSANEAWDIVAQQAIAQAKDAGLDV